MSLYTIIGEVDKNWYFPVSSVFLVVVLSCYSGLVSWSMCKTDGTATQCETVNLLNEIRVQEC